MIGLPACLHACLPATDSGLAMPFDFGCRIHAKSAHEATNEPLTYTLAFSSLGVYW